MLQINYEVMKLTFEKVWLSFLHSNLHDFVQPVNLTELSDLSDAWINS